MNIRILCSLLCLLIVNNVVHAQSVVIIVNAENSVRDISSDDLRYIFTADETMWDDGNSIQIVDWKTDNDVRRRFYAVIVRKSPAVVRRGWIQKIVAGNIYPPSVLSSEEEIIQYVAAHKWAIAYVSQQVMPRTVKTITVDGHTPDDPEYRIK